MAEVHVDGYEAWALKLDRAERLLTEGTVVLLQRKLALLALGAAVEIAPGRFRRISGVVLLTPVDTGRARSSWNVSVGVPDASVPSAGRRYSRRPAVIAGARKRLASLGRYQTVWITSSLPYITVLEYGGYPDPVALGTWDRKLRRYVIRSSGGYSKQAPRGMVRLTVGGLERALAEAAA